MTIRRKLSLLMLLLAATPLLIGAVVSRQRMLHLGELLTGLTREELIIRQERELSSILESHAETMRQRAGSLERVCLAQAAYAERLFSMMPKGAGAGAGAGSMPAMPRIAPSRRELEGGGSSYATQDIHGALGFVAPSDREALEAMLSIYQPLTVGIEEDMPIEALPGETGVFSQVTALESGSVGHYPRRGLLPAGYDARTTGWYQLSRRDVIEDPTCGCTAWGPPSVDPVTGEAVLTVSAPIRAVGAVDAPLLGVTMASSRIRDILSKPTNSALWVSRARLLVVALEEAQGSPDGPAVDRPMSMDLSGAAEDLSAQDAQVDAIRIFAEQQYAEVRGDWDSAIEVDSLTVDDPGLQEDLVASLRSMAGGTLTAEIDGVSTLIAFVPFAPHDPDNSTVVIALFPREDIDAIATSFSSLIEEHVAATVAANFGLLVAMIGVVFFVAFTLSRRITDPIGAIVIAARKLTAGDFSARAEVRTKDELEDLAGAFNEMGPALQDRVRMQQSLGLAMGVQQNLLPSGSPKIEGFDIAGLSVYCDETGGDYYDFLETDEGLGLILGDVTGHGVAAALLMTSARAMLRSRLALPGEPHEKIADVNDQLSHDANDGRFMTMLYLTIAGEGAQEPGAIQWVNAGHDPAFLYDPSTDSFAQLGEDGGIPLGVAAKWPYTTGGHEGMPPGSLLFIGTDGIWEAADSHGKMFGKPRLEAVLKACAGKPAKEVCEAVVAAVESFRGGAPQTDDITMVCVRRTK